MIFAALAPPVSAGEADVVKATATKLSDGNWRFSVTVRHADTGWKHYANAWQMVAPDGTVLGTRTLYHPHVDEQPFTRSLGPVRIPANVRRVAIRARDLVHAFGGKTVQVALPR